MRSSLFRFPFWSTLTVVACTPNAQSGANLATPTGVVAPPVPGAPTGVTAFVDVGVVPMDTDRVLTHQTVLIEGGRITALGPVHQIRVPAKATRIDGQGKFLLPGLADMHAHIFSGPHIATTSLSFLGVVEAPSADSLGAAVKLFLWLANGVTTLRNVDYYNPTWGRQTLRLRAQAAEGTSWIPHIYTAGPWGPEQYIRMSANATRPSLNNAPPPVLDSVASYVAAYKAAGYDFIKIHEERPVILDSVLAAAKRLGIPVIGHVPPPTTVEHILPLGYRSIEHTVNDYLRHGQTDEDPRDTTGIGTLAAAMRRANVWNCPTQSHYDKLHYDVMYDDYPNILKILQDSGVKLLVGTDEVPWQGVITRELQEFVTLGLTPYQALLADTRNVAVYFGTQNRRGTIAVGKEADLVLLTGNPLQDVRYTAQPAGVMLGGRWLSREAIDQRLATMTFPTWTPGTDATENAPVKSYWHNVVDEAVMTTAPVMYTIDLSDDQKSKDQTLQREHQARWQALLDSLEGSNHYQEGTQRIFQLLAQQLGDDRKELTPDQRAIFDPKASVWIRRRKADGYVVSIPGV